MTVSGSPRRFDTAHLASPRTLLLSNGRYSSMLTTAGSGYSRFGDVQVSRWYEDGTCDAQGSYVFLRDVRDGQVWSAGYQPTGREPDAYAVDFTEDRAQFVRRDGTLVTTLTCCIAEGEDAELRRVSLTNEARTAREIELTSYLEVVLTSAGADAAHPAFAKMFVQTEFDAASGTLLAMRRPRDAGDPALCVCHCLSLEGTAVGGLQFETDRARFLGRGHDLRQATCIVEARPLSNTVGTVLDPVLSLRRRVRLEPGETVHLNFWTGVAVNREAALALARRLTATDAVARTLEGARRKAQAVLKQLALSEAEAGVCQDIAGRLLYAEGSLRAPPAVLDASRASARGLWPHGLSGDRPLLLLRLLSEAGLRLVTPLLRLQEYLRLKGLTVDLAVLNEVSGQPGVQGALDAALNAYRAHLAGGDAGRGAVAVIEGAHLEPLGFDALRSLARVILFGDQADLATQAARDPAPAPRRRRRRENLHAAARADTPRAGANLEFFNGLGGFTAEGREYAITLGEGQWTPAPWVNVIANPRFGFLASADGTGSSWYLNAQQNQLTPWCNDPVSNTPAEAVYVRDETNGDLWSATPLPMREAAQSYVVRHGFGYTRTEHASHGIALELTQYVPLADTLKIARLRLTNRSGETRRLSVTHYVDWILGKERGRSDGIVTTRHASGALLARNPRSLDYGTQVAFLDAGGGGTLTGDRAEFLGRHGSLAEPGALLGLDALSNRVGGGLDPCGATQTQVELAAEESRELTLLLGAADSEEEAAALIEKYRQANLDAVLREVTDFWDRTVGALQVKTPDRSMDLMLNGWLLYQLIASRLWGRTGFYQSSGAYGYRDQLQDVMALCIAAPQETRAHLLRAAARQFIEGDVQHWWLPTTGQGIRTRIADDRLWLPYVVAHYVEVTGDSALLDEPVAYLGGTPLHAGEAERFEGPGAAAPEAEPLYRHCARALDSALAIGTHGLPLFGTGDWNDGMNRVGAAGRGESVWLGWFLHAALSAFAPLAARRGDEALASEWLKHAHAVAQAIEREAWDGDWYRRGYFDDGTPLGSVSSEECRIDSVAQSWAVLSGAAPRAHALQAMSAVNAQLVSRSDGLVKLFTPAFDHSTHDPGYIKAYPAGLRENGGQYTHGAVWNVLAFARLGNAERAAELFSLLNPVNHASTRAGIHRYKVEPYVICADVYAAPGHIGRGGWTWYTGSAGWMYRAGTEGLLGIHVRGTRLYIEPCAPKAWPGFEFTLKVGSSRYRVEVDNRREPGATRRASLDGKELQDAAAAIELVDDGHYHYAKITLARDP